MSTINVSQVRAKYNLQHKEAVRLLKDVVPVVEVPYAAGTMRLYNAVDVAAAIEPILEARRAAKLPPALPVVVPELPPQAAPQADLTPLSKQIDEAYALIEALQSQVAVIHGQHAALLRAIEKVGLDLSNKIDVLQQSVDMQDTAPAAPVVAHLPSAAPNISPASAPPKRKVTIIGLFDAHATHIYKEFKDVFDLRIYNIDEAKGTGVMNRMKDSEAVFIMTKFGNHSVENLAKAAGVKPIRVTGGQTAIRDKLTELFCNQPQQAA